MGGGVRRLAVICARGGSKGIKGKNLRDLAGKPLIAHSILQAKDCGLFDAVARTHWTGEKSEMTSPDGATRTAPSAN